MTKVKRDADGTSVFSATSSAIAVLPTALAPDKPLLLWRRQK